MKALQAKVRSDEPGNKLYALHKTADANVYVMLERYVDQAAIDFHRSTGHYKEVGAKIGKHLAAVLTSQARHIDDAQATERAVMAGSARRQILSSQIAGRLHARPASLADLSRQRRHVCL